MGRKGKFSLRGFGMYFYNSGTLGVKWLVSSAFPLGVVGLVIELSMFMHI